MKAITLFYNDAWITKKIKCFFHIAHLEKKQQKLESWITPFKKLIFVMFIWGFPGG